MKKFKLDFIHILCLIIYTPPNILKQSLKNADSCPVLVLEGGNVLMKTNTVGDIALHQCNNNSRLLGSLTRQCQANGKWSGVTSRCMTKNGMLHLSFLLLFLSDAECEIKTINAKLTQAIPS